MMRLFLAAIFIAAAAGSVWAEEPAPLGAPAFRPSVERPFGWRGDGSGRFPGATPVTEWSETKNVRWNTVVGSGYSSPVVTERCVFVTSEPDLLICLDRTDGKVRWKLALTPADLAEPNSRQIVEDYKAPKDGSGLAAATPVTDGRRVYVLFANGLLSAVDLDGHREWTAGITAAPSTGYGRSASPLIVAGKLIVHMTNLYAFDLATGRQLWVNEEAKSSYGTPAACRIAGAEFLLTPLGDLVRAADGQSAGSGLGHTTHSSPVAGEGLLFFGDSTTSALRLDPTTLKNESVWTGMVSGEVFGSPLLHDGTLFLTTGEGELFAFDARGKDALDPLINGRLLFEQTTASPAAYASLTLAGRYLFLTSNSGEVVVLEATREARLVSRQKLPAGTGSSPVFSGGDMFLRDGEKLWCMGR